MGKNKNILQKRKYEMIVFAMAFIPRMICSFFMIPVKVLMDEMCTLNGAASFAGLDWSNVVDKGSYYGFGFYSLLAFIFKITDNPYVIYHFILIILCLLQSLTGVICYHILTKHFKVKDCKWSAVAAVTCSYMVVSRAVAFVNEHPLILLTWTAVWLLLLLCEYQDNKKKKAFYTFLLLLLFSYAQLLHTRSITFLISFLLLVVLYWVVYGRVLVSVPMFLGTGVFFIPVVQWLVKKYQNNIWNIGSSINNSTINIVVSDKTFTKNGIKAIIDIVLGEINTIGVYTGGIAYVVIIVCVCIVSKCVKEKKKEKLENNFLFIITVFCCSCIAITIGGMAFSWGAGVAQGLSKEITWDFYSYKAFTYLRYFGPYLGPLLMGMLFYFSRNGKQAAQIVSVAIVVMIPVQFYWIKNIIPFIAKNTNTNSAFMLFAGWNESKELGSYLYFAGIKAMIIILFVYRCLKYYQKELASILMVCTVLVAQYLYGVYAQDVAWAEKNIVQADAGYEWVKEIEGVVVLPNEIYVKDNLSKSHHKSYYIYQFMLNRYVILPEEPEETVDEAILFENTAENIKRLQNMGFQYFQLDENEYVFIKGNRLIEELKNKGIEFEGT